MGKKWLEVWKCAVKPKRWYHLLYTTSGCSQNSPPLMGFCDEHLAGCYVSFTVIAQACLKVFLNFTLNASARAQSKSVYSYCLTGNCACLCCLWFEWLLAQCPAHYWCSEAKITPFQSDWPPPSAHPVRSICLSAIISSVSIYSVVVLNLTIQKIRKI